MDLTDPAQPLALDLVEQPSQPGDISQQRARVHPLQVFGRQPGHGDAHGLEHLAQLPARLVHTHTLDVTTDSPLPPERLSHNDFQEL